MLAPRFRWILPEPLTPSPPLAEAGRRWGLDERLLGLLLRRGIGAADELERFFGPPEQALHDPRRLPDADAFRDRIHWAVQRGERILAFGDFDADGLTGLAILVRTLRALGADVVPYVPSRVDEGHGLSLAALDAATAAGATLIVTIDCGSTSVVEIDAARSRGLDVLVTDHHRVPDPMPAAQALVNPHRPDADYPDRRLAGSGVAFKLAQLLLAEAPGGPEAALALADLATIGTVADVAPVLGENRAIARLGLERLRAAPRPGLAALLERAAIEPGAVDLETIAFGIAPRLNAAGRVGEAFDAARLLLTDDPAEAAELAETLERANATRRDLMKTALAEARTSPDAVDDAPATLVHGPWPVGIVGLVAGKLAEEHGRPAIVGAELGPTIRASCRGDGRLDLGAAIAACGDLLLRHGGHAGAAGFEIEAAAWPAFRKRFLPLAAATAADRDAPPALQVDVEIPARGLDYALLRDLGRLAPAGTGNPEPLVAVLGLQVVRAREATGGHTQLVLKRELDVVDGIAFGWPELAASVTEGERVDVLARVVSRRFGGIESLQLDIRDAAASAGRVEARAVAPLGALAT
ncbi:MAG: single-stranded-DNA-specific exonuclease RecJ [Chloroflexi bacterium]|nr:single-stranded-DNA-specific exonuclease RecJ [Chloroflexota bacterium]